MPRRAGIVAVCVLGCATEHPRPPAAYLPEVYIEYRADNRDAILERRYRNWEWIPVCSSPCARTVRPDFEYRVGGTWIVPSRPFLLYQPTNITATAGTREGRALGVLAVVAGIPLTLLGLAITLVGASNTEDGSGALVFGATGLVLGGVLTAAGAATIAANHTDVELRDRSPGAKLTFKF